MNENAQRERDSELLVKWEVVLLMLDTTNRRHWALGGPNRATHPSCPGGKKWKGRTDRGLLSDYWNCTVAQTNWRDLILPAEHSVGGEGQSREGLSGRSVFSGTLNAS